MSTSLKSHEQYGICRDCLREIRLKKNLLPARCPFCANPRLFYHRNWRHVAIGHIDCDAFFAAIEKRDNPELLNKPVITKNDKKRATMRKALSLLQQAGYKNQNGQLVDSDGKQLSVEVLVANVYDGTEKAALVFKENLADIGIELRLRQVDASQFWQRIKEFDFDMIDFRYTASLSPGIEQQFRWSSKAADTKGTFNFAGVKSKPLDELIQKIVEARNEDDFVNAIKAYDRALMSGFYVVPLFYNPKQWIGAWSYVKVPKTTPIFGARPDTWWYDKQ